MFLDGVDIFEGEDFVYSVGFVDSVDVVWLMIILLTVYSLLTKFF